MFHKETKCIKNQGVKTFEQDEDVQIFHFTCFPGGTIYLDLRVSFWSISECLNLFQ